MISIDAEKKHVTKSSTHSWLLVLELDENFLSLIKKIYKNLYLIPFVQQIMLTY